MRQPVTKGILVGSVIWAALVPVLLPDLYYSTLGELHETLPLLIVSSLVLIPSALLVAHLAEKVNSRIGIFYIGSDTRMKGNGTRHVYVATSPKEQERAVLAWKGTLILS